MAPKHANLQIRANSSKFLLLIKTTPCPRRPLLSGPKSGRITQVWLCIGDKLGTQILDYWLIATEYASQIFEILRRLPEGYGRSSGSIAFVPKSGGKKEQQNAVISILKGYLRKRKFFFSDHKFGLRQNFQMKLCEGTHMLKIQNI